MISSTASVSLIVVISSTSGYLTKSMELFLMASIISYGSVIAEIDSYSPLLFSKASRSFCLKKDSACYHILAC